MTLWWLSFADPKAPVGHQFLGVAIVEAADPAGAIKAAWALGCNPGGEVAQQWLDPVKLARLSFPLPTGRLLDRIEVSRLSDRISAELSD